MKYIIFIEIILIKAWLYLERILFKTNTKRLFICRNTLTIYVI